MHKWEMGALFHYHFIRTDDALPHHSHCKDQSNTVNPGGKTWWSLLCAQLSIGTSIYIRRNKRCQKGQIWAIPLTSCVVHREMKVLKESLGPFNTGNFRMCISGTFWKAGQHHARPAAHTNSWGLLKLSDKEQILPWFCGVHAALVQWHRLSPRRLCPVSSIPHKAQVTSRWHELTANMPISELALNPADTCEYGFQSHYCFPLPVKGRDSPSPTAAQPSPPHFHLADAALTLKLQLDPSVLSWTLCSSRAELEEPPGSKTNPRVLWTLRLCLPARAPGTAGRAGSRAGSWSGDSLGAGLPHGAGPAVVLRGFCLGFQTLPLFTARRQTGRLSLAA